MCGCKGKCGCNIISTTKGEKGDASPVASLGYKVYTALLDQSSTSAPTAIVLMNTLGATPTFSYDSTGNYSITATGIFTLNKTTCILSQYSGALISCDILSANSISITTEALVSGLAQNGILYKTMIEIRVYS